MKSKLPTFDIPDGPACYLPDWLLELHKQGLAGSLWTIEIEFNNENERRIQRFRNLKGSEANGKIAKWLHTGFELFVGPGHWRIIMPLDIIRLDLYRQSGYFSG